jgi:SAM-dependent methyltransferase
MSQSPATEYDSQGHGFVCRPIECPTCKADDTEYLGMRGGRFHRHGLGIPNRIVRCRRCGLRYANPFPFPVDAQELYGDPDKYFSHQDTHQKVETGRRLVRGITEHFGRPLTSLLDVGGGRGELLHAARLEGVPQVIGLEFSESMIQHAEKHYQVSMLHQSVEDFAASTSLRFDAVVLNAVLEHVYDPDAMIAAIKTVTRPGSILYIDVPNESHLLGFVGNTLNRLRGSEAVLHLSPTFRPYHVFGFDRRSLDTLLAKHAFRIRAMRIRAEPRIPSSPQLADRVKSRVGEQIMKLANLTRTASNMFVWAERVA